MHLVTFRAIKSSDFVMFYDWETTTFIQKVEMASKDIFWSQTGNTFAISSSTFFYTLQFNKEVRSPSLAEARPIS